MKYLEGDEELFVHLRLSKRTLEPTVSYWGRMSFMLELGFLLTYKVCTIMSMYWHHAIPF